MRHCVAFSLTAMQYAFVGEEQLKYASPGLDDLTGFIRVVQKDAILHMHSVKKLTRLLLKLYL